MSRNMETANEFIRSLREQRDAYRKFTEEEVLPLFRDNDQQDRRPPRHFVDSSFLYARSFDADNGSRPFSNQVFWLSPDIHVSPITNLAAYTRTLNAGETYNISCAVRNRGDMGVPSAKVEFWLTDPTLGFDTRYASHLTLGNVPSTWVGANSSGLVNFTYTVPPLEQGHKCLFARLFSFSPLDIPVDDYRLDPTIDRHIAQQNLNIVNQGQPFQFNWIHAPNAEQQIQFVPMMPKEVMALRHPVLADVQPFEDFPRHEWTAMTGIELLESEAAGFSVDGQDNLLFVRTEDPDGSDLGLQRELRERVRRTMAAIEAGRTQAADHRDLFAKFREVNREVRRTSFQMQVPNFGLDVGQAIGVHLRAMDSEGGDAREALGGLTLLITG